MTISPRQRRLIDALLTAGTRIEACQAAGVGKSTLDRWSKDPEFANALQNAQTELFADGYARLLSDQRANLDELARLRDGADNEHVRLRAAVAWEGALVKRFELLALSDLARRIEALENRP